MLQSRPRRLRRLATASASVRWVVAGEFVILLGLFAVYKYARLLIGPSDAVAFEHAHRVLDLERLLRLPSELPVQELLLSGDALIRAANMFYAYVHFPATGAFLCWVLVRSRRTYFEVRTVLVLMTAAALAIHTVFPLAPPRMLAGQGFVDTAAVYGPSVYHAAPQADGLANQLAAMPSLHVGWAIVVGLGVVRAGRSRLRWLWLLHPVATLLVVVGTGNHYWLDAAVAGGLLVVADVVVRRSRCGRWLARPVTLPPVVRPVRWRRARPGSHALAYGVAPRLVDGGLESHHQGLHGQRLVSLDHGLDGLGVAAGVAVQRPHAFAEQGAELARDRTPVLGEDPGGVRGDVRRNPEVEELDADAEMRDGDVENVVVRGGFDGADGDQQLEVRVR